MAQDNTVVVRHSPDWLNFDVQASRQFCASLNLPETTVVDYVALWDDCLAVDYRRFRHELKIIAARTWAATGAAVVDQHAFDPAGIQAASLVAFVDDDDWFAPDLFEALEPHRHHDYLVWGSVRLGGFYNDAAAAENTTALMKRDIELLSYTNNYAVTAAALLRHGLDRLAEHFNAQTMMASGVLDVALLDRYLSVANKSAAATLSALHNLASPAFRADPRRSLEQGFRSILDLTIEQADLQWMEAPLADYKRLIARCLA